MARQLLAVLASLLLTLAYLALAAILSIQASGVLAGVVYSFDNVVRGTQEPHVPWYYLLALAVLTGLMFFLASSKDLLLLAGVRRPFAVTMLVVLVAALVTGALSLEPLRDGVPPGLGGWVQDWGTNPAVYVLAVLLVLQLVRDRGGVEALPPEA
jgi:hypothetical protein